MRCTSTNSNKRVNMMVFPCHPGRAKPALLFRSLQSQFHLPLGLLSCYFIVFLLILC